jgi:hypothetical protein
MRYPFTQEHECSMSFRGLRKNSGKEFELWECIICGREEIRQYTGSDDTIEYRI